MESFGVALASAVGSLAFFAFLAFAVWVDYRKKKDDRAATSLERIKALEMGHAPPDAEIERAKAYASAAWAAGLIGLLVPLALVSLTVGGTLVVLLVPFEHGNLTAPLIVAWSLSAFLVLVAVWRSLSVIRHLPRPTAETPPRVADPLSS